MVRRWLGPAPGAQYALAVQTTVHANLLEDLENQISKTMVERNCSARSSGGGR